MLCCCCAAVSKQDDCEVGAGGARKACKNCSCGRAEAEAKGEKVQLTKEMLENPQSSCGNVSGAKCVGYLFYRSARSL